MSPEDDDRGAQRSDGRPTPAAVRRGRDAVAERSDPCDRDNPYERWDIDPLGGPAAITERMRELAEDAPDEASRKAIRAAWEELTLHPARRLRAALSAHPDTHGHPGAPPPAPPAANRAPEPLTLSDLALRPSVLAALGADEPTLLDLPLERDPVLKE